jgi:hypothetical protein
MARQQRNHYVSGQKLRAKSGVQPGVDTAANAVAFARAFAPVFDRDDITTEDAEALLSDCRVLIGGSVVTALQAVGIN